MGKSMTDKLVSVLIPTIKGREHFLERAVKSVKNQTYKNVEIIIVNEGKPAQEQRNIGVRRANGEYIAFLDDDDFWADQNYLSTMVDMLEKHGAVMASCAYFDERINKIRIPFAENTQDLLLSFSNIETSATIFTKDVYKKAGGVDMRLKSGHNHDLFYRISKLGKFITVYKSMVVKGFTGEGIGTSRINKIQGYVMFHWKFRKDILKLPVEKLLFVLLKFIITFTIFVTFPNIRSMLYEKVLTKIKGV